MSLHDEDLNPAAFVQDEGADCLSGTLAGILGRLSPAARLRLFAFLHLVENPATMKASLEIEPTGALRLTLDTFVAPCRGQQH